jgi:hypothetical protein
MVDVLGLSRQLFQNPGIFFLCHGPGRAAVSVAKRAVHIANIGDFHIGP